MIDAMKKQNPMQLWADPNITFNDCNAARSTSQSARAYPVGRIVGGGSAINGMGAIRGHPDDFLEWEETFMVKGWGWETMLKAFKDLESDPMAAERPDIHGADGPIPIYRSKCETWGPVAATMKKGCMETLGNTDVVKSRKQKLRCENFAKNSLIKLRKILGIHNLK